MRHPQPPIHRNSSNHVPVHTKDCGITSQSFIVSVITLNSLEIAIGGCMSEYAVLLERQIILRTSLVVEAASEEEAREKVQHMIDYDEFGTVEELGIHLRRDIIWHQPLSAMA